MSNTMTTKGPAKLKNYVAIVLDESGSMESMRQETIDAFNQQAEAIRTQAADMETLVSLVKFNTSVPDPVYWSEPAATARPITKRDYEPNGWTAMLDAVGLTIDRLCKVKDADAEDVSFLVVIISDGEENNSKRYTWQGVAEKIQTLDKTGRWTFAYMGSNQDLGAISRKMAIPMDNVAAFTATPGGVKEASDVQVAASMAFVADRRAGFKSSKSFYKKDDADRTPTEVPPAGSSWDDAGKR